MEVNLTPVEALDKSNLISKAKAQKSVGNSHSIPKECLARGNLNFFLEPN